MVETETSGATQPSSVARPPPSPLARLSFWCGIAACVTALLAPILLVFAFLLVYPLAVLAVGIGVTALLHIRRAPAVWGGRRWAVIGIVLGGAWLLFLMIAVVLNSG